MPLALPRLMPGSGQRAATSPLRKRLFGYFHALYMSFYSLPLYVDVRYRWRGYGIAYLLLLSVTWSTPFLVRVTAELYQQYTTVVYPVLTALPKVTIRQGKFYYHGHNPLIIRHPKTGQPYVVVDTRKTIRAADVNRYPSAKIFLSDARIWLNLGRKPVFKSTKWSAFDDGDLKGPALSLITAMAHVFLLCCYPMGVSLFFGALLTLHMTTGWLFQAVANTLMKESITYITAVRIAIVASTPSMLLLGAALLLGCHNTATGVAVFVGLWLYFVLAVRSSRQGNRALVTV